MSTMGSLSTGGSRPQAALTSERDASLSGSESSGTAWGGG
jgi:hypothetical protein